MKKLMGISVIAALAVMPMAANAARTVTANTNVTPGQNAASTLAAQSYVQGAYNAANNQINALIEDTAVAAKAQGEYAAIKAGDKVSENLVALDEKIATLESETNGTVGDLRRLDDSFGTGENKADTVEEALGSLDGRLDTVEGDIATLKNTAATEGSVKNTVKTEAESADYTGGGQEGNGMTATTISGAIDELDGRVDALETNTSFTAEEVAAHDLITSETDIAGNVVSIATAVENMSTSSLGTLADDGNYIRKANSVTQNLSALDQQVKTNADAIATINNKQIPIVTSWTDGTVVNTKVSELVTAQ